MTASLLAALVLAQPVPLKVAAPDFSVAGLEAGLVTIFHERFVSRLGGEGVTVTTQRDINQLLGMERQRVLLGCPPEAGSCMAELAGALGVEAVVMGSLARTGKGFLVNLRVLDAADGSALDTPSARVASEDALLDWLDATGAAVRERLLQRFRPGRAVAQPPPRWVPGVIGGALLAGAAACFTFAALDYRALNGPSPLAHVGAVRSRGEALQWAGVGLAVLGAAGVLWSIIWAASAPPVQVAVVADRQGLVLGLSGAWP